MNSVLKIVKSFTSTWKLMYSLAILLFAISYFYGLTWHNIRSIFILTICYLISLIAFFFFIFNKNEKSQTLINQIFCVYLFSCIFFDLSFFSKYVEKTYLFNNLIGLLSLHIPVLVILVMEIYKKTFFNISISKIRANWELLLIIILFVLLSVETINSMTRLDTNIYYTYLNEAKRWNLSFDTITNFKLGGHQSIGYSLWGLIGIYLSPNSPVGIRIVNIFIVIISIATLRQIYFKIFPVNSRLLIFLAVSLFAFNPLVLGIIYEINLDLPCLCFYIWVIYSLLFEKKILLLVSSFFLVFSKETGILLLFGCAIGWSIQQLYQLIKSRNKTKWYNTISWKIAIIFLTSPVLFFLSTFVTPLWRQDSLTTISEEIQSMDSFGINSENTLIKAKELFVLNFVWIASLLIIVSLLVLFVRKNKRKLYKIEKFMNSLPLLVSTSIFVLFQFLYITYCHIRYIMPYLPGAIALLFITLILVFNKRIVVVLCSGYLGLSLVENFFTLDPISKYVCNTIDIGQSEILTTRTFVRSTENTIQTIRTAPVLIENLQLTQSAIYNRQYLYFMDAFEEVLQDISYDDSTYICIAPIFEDGGDEMTWISLFGRWYSNELFYDNNTKKCVDDETKKKINISVISEVNEVPYANYENIYLLSFPYNNLFDNERFLKQFNIIESSVVYEKLWEIQVYKLK